MRLQNCAHNDYDAVTGIINQNHGGSGGKHGFHHENSSNKKTESQRASNMIEPLVDPLDAELFNDNEGEFVAVVRAESIVNAPTNVETFGQPYVQDPNLPFTTAEEARDEWTQARMRRHTRRSFHPDEELNLPGKDSITCTTIPVDWRPDSFDNLVEKHWNVLQKDLISVLNVGYREGLPTTKSITDLRDHVKTCINYRRSTQLNEKLRGFLNEYVPSIFTVLLDPSGDLITTARDNWLIFKDKISILYEVFLDLNGHVGSAVALRPVWPMAIQCVRVLLEDNFNVFESVADGVIQEINNERNGIQIDGDRVHKIIEMFVMLQAYETIFEPRFFAATQKFYEQESQTMFADTDVPKYLRHAEKRIREETLYYSSYLDLKSKGPNLRIVHKCLVTNHTAQIVEKGCKLLFNGADGAEADLSLMYQLFKDSEGGFDHLKEAFVAHVKQIGEARMNATGQEKTLVADLLETKAKLDRLVVQCFEKNPMFLEAQKDAFAYFINLKKDKPAELIAKFMDLKMKNVNKTLPEAELDQLMDQVIMLFRFISGKDVFEAFYKRDLSKRLLLGRCASVDAEKSMLDKLRAECGPGFTSKLECMFKDMEISKELCAGFKEHLKDTLPVKQRITADFSISVLTTSSWPVTDGIAEVSIPKQLCKLQTKFAKYYIDMNKGRRLAWHHDLASAILVGKFSKGKKELDVSLYQALVLLMFNDKNQFTFEEIQTATQIEQSELVRTLIALISVKNPILIREKAENARFIPTEVLKFNDKYHSKSYKVKIAQVQMKETEKEHEQTEYEIQQDRQFVIDAGIVRLMKEHRRITHQQLVHDLMDSLRFTSTVADIKKRIENLIEREYLKRCDDDNQSYDYVA
uniref:CULLIN_2 domain-containing protein n=1 Tax=Panagrellus redivivus TaxID=6233 RepID=A0A7E4VRF6_PANRE